MRCLANITATKHNRCARFRDLLLLPTPLFWLFLYPDDCWSHVYETIDPEFRGDSLSLHQGSKEEEHRQQSGTNLRTPNDHLLGTSSSFPKWIGNVRSSSLT